MSDIDFKKLSREMAGREGLGGSTIMFTIIALVGLALVWANWAELDNVTRGEGRIVSSVQNQMVQASEGGVILRRYVSENTVVAEGDVLFEIDPGGCEQRVEPAGTASCGSGYQGASPACRDQRLWSSLCR